MVALRKGNLSMKIGAQVIQFTHPLPGFGKNFLRSGNRFEISLYFFQGNIYSLKPDWVFLKRLHLSCLN